MSLFLSKKRIINLYISILITFFLIFLFLSKPQAVFAFRFVAWGDTKSDTNTLRNLSNQMISLNPNFTIYAGDLESSGFTQAGMDVWKAALNGGANNGMFDKTFPVRGNHDSSNAAGWQAYFNLSAVTQRVGATNYLALDDNLTYSFDFDNSRIIGVDILGNVSQMTSTQIAWIDQRLTDAENRGLTHAFLYWHGPFYSQANHCCPIPPPALISVINNHPIVSATFHGHEHILTYTRINSSRVAGITRGFEQIVTGDAGAGPTSPTAGRYDYALDLAGANMGGFVAVDVSGSSFTLNFYKGGVTTSQYSRTFSKGGPPPTTPQTSPTRTPTPLFTPTRTPTLSQTQPPTVRITEPIDGQIVTDPITIRFTKSGNLSQVDHVTFQVDNDPEIAHFGPGIYYISGLSGTHTITIYLVRSDGSHLSNPEAMHKITVHVGAPSQPTPTVTPSGICPLKQKGDANCDSRISLLDFEAWRREFIGYFPTTTSDFNSDGRVSLTDFEIWRRGFLGV